jgi:hypothetical protein
MEATVYRRWPIWIEGTAAARLEGEGTAYHGSGGLKAYWTPLFTIVINL